MANKRNLDIIIGAKDDTAKGTTSVQKSIGRMADGLRSVTTGIGISIGQTITKIVSDVVLAIPRSVARAFEDIDVGAKVTDRLGLTSAELEGFRLAASLAGSSAQTMDNALQELDKNLGQIATGIGERAKPALDALGLSADKMLKMAPAERFLTVADAISKISNSGQRAAVAQKLLGDNARELANTLMLGRAGLEASVTEAQSLGFAVSRVDAANVEAANDAVSRMKLAFVGLGRTLAVTIAPLVEELAVSSQRTIQRITDGIKLITTGLSSAVEWATGITGSLGQQIQLLFHDARIGFYQLMLDMSQAITEFFGGDDNAVTLTFKNLVEDAERLKQELLDRIANPPTTPRGTGLLAPVDDDGKGKKQDMHPDLVSSRLMQGVTRDVAADAQVRAINAAANRQSQDNRTIRDLLQQSVNFQREMNQYLRRSNQSIGLSIGGA